jgi:GNAT superfamily N-acetyltransferase
MGGVKLPQGFRIERLRREHRRASFRCGEDRVDDWLRSKALQHQTKHLSVTKVLLSSSDEIAGFYTLATGQVEFGELPQEIFKHLPRRALPVAVLAWLGVSRNHQARGLGGSLLAQALRDCFEAGQTFAFVAVLLDCLNDQVKAFYQRWDFKELPGQPYRLFLSVKQVEAMMQTP